MRVTLPELCWYGNTTIDIDLPEEWNVGVYPMNGADAPALSVQAQEEAVNAPIGSPSISELAIGKKTAVIIFDDMTRATRTGEIASAVIKQLNQGGIADEDITFVCALGTHGALTSREFRKKLGPKILENYRVFNHNIYENCVEVGTTSRGTKVMINREVAQADLKIAISCAAAHPQLGFSGGGKIVLPGITHIDTISNFHLEVSQMDPDSTGMGKYPNNILYMEAEEAALLAKIDYSINVLVNGRGLTSAIYAGELRASHQKAIEVAIDHYNTDPSPTGMDLCISNAFIKANEMTIAFGMGMRALKDFSKTLVVLANSPEGQVIHYLLGKFGRNYGGRQYPVATMPPDLKVIVVAPHADKMFGDWFGNPESIVWTKSWDEALEMIKPDLGPGSNVAVIPNATIQYYKQ